MIGTIPFSSEGIAMYNSKVSIVVPIYNMEQYLEKCIQTYTNIEIILVNDGSCDRSASICEKYRAEDNRILYIEQENQGVSAARNTGLYQATGEWISFVDGDDWVTTDMVSQLLRDAENYDVVIGDVYIADDKQVIQTSFFSPNISEDKKKTTLYLIGNALDCSYYGTGKYCNIGVPWARIYNREFLVKNNLEFPVGIRRMQDMVFNIDVFLKTKSISFCNQPIYYYRITANSTCRRYDPNYEEVTHQILFSLHGSIGNNPEYEIQKLYTYKRVWLLLENIMLNFGHYKCTLSKKEKRNGIKQLCSFSDNAIAIDACEKKLLSRKQKLILWFLSHHFYGIILKLYSIKQSITRRNYGTINHKK